MDEKQVERRGRDNGLDPDLAGAEPIELLAAVEQDLKRALRVASRVICMLEGRVVLAAAARDTNREQVTEAYFGLGRGRSAGARPGAP